MGKPVSRVVNAFVPGPLAEYAGGFRQWLLEQGYTPLTTVPQLQLMAHVSSWLDREGLAADSLGREQAGRFLADHHAAGHQRPKSLAGLRPLLGYLGGLRALPPEPPEPPPDAAAALISVFAEYLRAERGLAPMTVAAYSSRAARFLAAALRAFLRYCHVQGLVAADVSAAAMAVTGQWTLLLPRGLEPGQVTALLGACDRDEPEGRRDYAVILLLARLGLRAGEAARLRLEDIDWRAGEIGVRGKGGQFDRLPLPADAGAAIAA